ncbi:MAG TPA: CbiX/SirB N-terminal domain-containing protein [Casimicrobiaceae bacterium]|jgi:sirohydrochlorin cobaltochelatase
MDRRAVILYAHGARDARWAEPFERLLRRLREKRPDVLAALAFLDYLEPDLKTAAQALAAEGITSIRIVPLFFGRGGHLRDDFPKQLTAVQAALPQVQFEVLQAAGEAPEVLEALADFALSGLE